MAADRLKSRRPRALQVPPAVHSAGSPAGTSNGTRRATPADITFVRSLAKRHTDAVGFLPTAAVEWYLDAGGVSIAVDNGQPAGYLLCRDALASSTAIRPILQAAVCYDARRRRHGLALVDRLAADAQDAGRKVLQLKCREELEANAFWAAAGFTAVGWQDAGRRRAGRVLVWARQVAPLTPADLIHKTVERHRGPGGFYSSKPLVIHRLAAA